MRWIAVPPALVLAFAPLVAPAQDTVTALTFDQLDRSSLAAPVDADSTFARDYQRWVDARSKGEILSQHAFQERVVKLISKDASAKAAVARLAVAAGTAANMLDQATWARNMIPGLGGISSLIGQGASLFSGGGVDLQTLAAVIPGPTGMIARTVLSFLPSKFKTVHFGPNASSLAGVPVAQLDAPLKNEARIGRLTHYTIAGNDVRIDDPLGDIALIVIPESGKAYRLDALQKTYESYDIPKGENPLAFLTGGAQPREPSLLVTDTIDASANGSGVTGGVATQHFDARERLSIQPVSGKCDQPPTDVSFERSDDVAAFAGPPVLPFYPFDSEIGAACSMPRYALSGSAGYGDRFVVSSRSEIRSGNYTMTTLTERGNVAHPAMDSVRALFRIPSGFREERPEGRS